MSKEQAIGHKSGIHPITNSYGTMPYKKDGQVEQDENIPLDLFSVPGYCIQGENDTVNLFATVQLAVDKNSYLALQCIAGQD
jgi:hypothetical protein